MKLVFATNNFNKLEEVKKSLPQDMTLLSLKEINCFDDIEETGNTLRENASIKSHFIYKNYGFNCFSDDTGLEVEALNGEPGVFSARYAGEPTDSSKNIAKILQKMAGISNRSAQFRTVISLILEGKEYQFEGVCKGEIRHDKKGIDGFGYDPIFQPEGFNKTFSEMTKQEKNKISHRGIAMRKLIHFLENYKRSSL